jgi:putative spermidine/putrescine transport system permease protein
MLTGLRLFLLVSTGLFLLTPVIVLVGVSFHETRQMVFPPANPNLNWYAYFFNELQWRSAFLTSLYTAAAAALLATVVAMPLAYSAWQLGGRLTKTCIQFCMVSCLMPAVVMALGFLLFWGRLGLAGGPLSIIFSHSVSFVALPLVTITLGLRSIGNEWMEAARMLGAREGFRFRTLVLPYLVPYIVSGYLFVFVLSLNEYIIAFMVAGFATETLPVRVFNSLRSGFVPAMAVGAVVFYLIGLLVFALNARFGHLDRLLGIPRERR